MYRRSNDIDTALAAAHPSDLRLQRSAFVGTLQVGEALVGLGDEGSAIAYFRRACDAGARLAATDPKDVEAQSDAAAACERLGSALARTGAPAEALRMADERGHDPRARGAGRPGATRHAGPDGDGR